MASGSAPCAWMVAFISGVASSLLISAFTTFTTVAGVPAGANTPYQVLTSKSLKPDSDTVGTSGMDELRLAEVTASGRSLPDLIWAMADGTEDMSKSTLPDSASISAGLEPLYGMWLSLMPAAFSNRSPARWMEVPLPGDP